MPVQHIHTYLVHPGKGSEDDPQIGGTTVSLSDKLFNLLDNIYFASDNECDIDIIFRPTNGRQENPCRDLMIDYLSRPTLPKGRLIAERLERMTDKRSGLGLLFLIAGKERNKHKIVISRFPTDSAILADENQSNLTVEFLERVFMKSKFSYKAVVYQDSSLQTGFWEGRAIDKQTNTQSGEPSNYWIADFLESDFSVTPAAGTRRLAVALRGAAKNANLEVKAEIAAAATLAGGLKGKQTSVEDFLEQFGMSPDAREAVRVELKNPDLASQRFRLDWGEFTSLIAYRSIELDNGALMTAPSAEFDDVFHQEAISPARKEVRYWTQGKVIDEMLKKGR